ncbi:hypothetical protein EVAR_28832_1 [Eumeta japonica]|uniref:Uncharacterized protein n=1 Tax=Eumeta variegata TaxID=151549 RepID=A0A4C1WIE5_EUMVA|nr:hypothetical protein EVAR_28832_1 [Eumeta japonica]
MRKEANITRCSQAVTHPSTDRARRCLTSVIGREPVYSACICPGFAQTGIVSGSVLKAGGRAGPRARTATEIDNGAGPETESRIGIRIKRATRLEIACSILTRIEGRNEIRFDTKVFPYRR